jgi:hypothetical protein
MGRSIFPRNGLGEGNDARAPIEYNTGVKMKKNQFLKGFLLLAVISFSSVLLLSDDDYSFGPATFTFDGFMINHFPGGNFYTFFIENYVPDATFLLEENNAFSLIDNPRVYFEGDSFIQFNWLYNGLNLNSSLNHGAPAVMLPFASITSMQMRGESPLHNDYGMSFLSDLPEKSFSRLKVSNVFPNMGGYGPWAKFMVQPSHPSERADRLYNERRKIKSNFYIDYLWSKVFGDSQFMVSMNYFDITRRFNDFNTFDTTFEEEGKLFLAHSIYKKNLHQGYYKIFGIYNYLKRSAQGAELAMYPQETTKKDRHSINAGFSLEKKKFDVKLSVLYEDESITPNQLNFTKDLFDTDGDMFYPFDRLGKFKATTVNLSVDVPLTFNIKNRLLSLNIFARGRYASLSGEETIHDFNPILFNGDSYLVYQWSGDGSNYRNTNVDMNTGFNITYDISKDFSFITKLWLAYNNIRFTSPNNKMNFITPGFDVGILLFKSKKSKILLSYGRIPNDIRENVNFFLEKRRPYADIYQWNDLNNDLSFQPGEEIRFPFVGNTSGWSHNFNLQELSAPLKERLLLHFSTPISKNFTLNIKGIYKKHRNHFRVKFLYDDYGFYENIEGQDFFFFNKIDDYRDDWKYLVVNNYLEKDPFYAQFHFNIKGRRENKWVCSFSFMAHMGMGDTAFGNGPGSNDIGILSESQANPNSWINGFGRLDGDRGFVAKGYFGFYITKRLFMAMSLKYRDGTPFAFINTLSKHDQHILYYKTIKAENEKGVKGGPREDYISDMSIRFNYKFKFLNKDSVLSLTCFNIFDSGGELSEYVFSGGTRDAVELQIPRSLRLTFEWVF